MTTVAAAHVGPDGAITRVGPTDRPFDLASVTKLLSALAVLVAHEEGTLPLDEVVTAEGATTADLLAHAGGVAPDDRRTLSPPGTRRIYSTAGYEILADEVAARAGIAFATYLHEAVCEPLAMTTTVLDGSAGAGARGSVEDLLALVDGWRRPRVIDAVTLTRATRPHRPELAGVLPGFGRHDPEPWGLGPEIRGDKSPHWTGTANSPATYGHFGRSGTFLWIDPLADHALVVLTDEPFGEWAVRAWPVLADGVLAATG